MRLCKGYRGFCRGDQGAGFKDITQCMENQMEENTVEHEMGGVL